MAAKMKFTIPSVTKPAAPAPQSAPAAPEVQQAQQPQPPTVRDAVAGLVGPELAAEIAAVDAAANAAVPEIPLTETEELMGVAVGMIKKEAAPTLAPTPILVTPTPSQVQQVIRRTPPAPGSSPINWRRLESQLFWGIRANVPTLLIGPPGNAKTAMAKSTVNALARQGELGRNPFKFRLGVFTLSNAQQGQFTLYIPSKGEYDEVPAKFFRECDELYKKEKTISVILFDEAPDARANIQSMVQEFVNSGALAQLDLKESTRFILTGNPPKHSTTGGQLSNTFVNRLTVHTVIPQAKMFAEYLDAFGEADGLWTPPDWISNEDIKAMSIDQWKMMSTFVKRREELFTCEPPEDLGANEVYTSWRSTENALKLASVGIAYGVSSSDLVTKMAETMGGAAVAQFLAFSKELNLPDIEKVVAGYTKSAADGRSTMDWASINRDDQKFALITGVVAQVGRELAVARGKKDKKREVAVWNGAWEFIGDAHRVGEDTAGRGAFSLLELRQSKFPGLPTPPAHVMAQMQATMVAAGMGA